MRLGFVCLVGVCVVWCVACNVFRKLCVWCVYVCMIWCVCGMGCV